MEIIELINFCTEFDIGGKLLDITIIILYLCGKKKTAEEIKAKKEKDLKRQKKKTAKALEKAKAEAEKQQAMEKE